MTSTIARDQPQAADATLHEEVRANFNAAADDIEALQALTGIDADTAVAAAGSDLATATALAPGLSVVATSTATTADGVKLGATANAMYVVYNATANTLDVFPPSGGTINGGSADAAVTLAASKSRIFFTKNGAAFFSMLGA